MNLAYSSFLLHLQALARPRRLAQCGLLLLSLPLLTAQAQTDPKPSAKAKASKKHKANITPPTLATCS